MKLKIRGNEAVIDGEEGFASKIIEGRKGKLKIKTPFGEREIELVDEFKTKAKAKKKKAKA